MKRFGQVAALMLICSPSAGKPQDLGHGFSSLTRERIEFRFSPNLGELWRLPENAMSAELVARTGVDINAPAPPKMGEPAPLGLAITNLLKERDKQLQLAEAALDFEDMQTYQAAVSTIAEIDIKLEAAVARQAIEEARDFNAPQRLNVIWSAQKARSYEFVPVAEGVFDIFVDSKLQFTDVPIEQIVHDTLVMADKTYASMQADLAQKEDETHITALGSSQGGLLGAQQEAVSQQDADAQNNLGLMYSDGSGVIQDYITAHMWFNIAGANGSSDARENRDRIAKLMTPADLSEAQRRARACMASNYQDCD